MIISAKLLLFLFYLLLSGFAILIVWVSYLLALVCRQERQMYRVGAVIDRAKDES